MKKLILVSAILTFNFSLPLFAYIEVIDLGGLNEYPISYAWSVNNSGQIVGWAEANEANLKAVIFDNIGAGAFDLNVLDSIALSRNANRIAGEANDIACIFDSNGSGAVTFLGGLGGSRSCASSINNNNQIVGWAENNLIYQRACIFDNTGAGNNFDCNTLGGLESEATSINNSNVIVGWADNVSNFSRACIFDSSGDCNNNIDLGTLGGDFSMAWSINNNNQVVGWAFNESIKYRACLFDSSGGGNNIDLGALTPDGNSEAYCINDKGIIVGYAEDSLKQTCACIFNKTAGGYNIALNALIEPDSGWTLTHAFSINNDGWIAGQGIHDGQQHAFLLKLKALELTTPNGDEILNQGNIYSITWSSTGSINNVLIEYSNNNGLDWNPIAVAANTGSYDWLVPSINSNQCLIRISDSDDSVSLADQSDSVFTIAKIYYIDDDAPGDPQPNDPNFSDPVEDGTIEHPFDAIQEGIDAAIDGCIIIVQFGQYTGSGNRDIDFKGKAVTVRSVAPDNPDVVETTVINCINSNCRGFIFCSGEEQNSILEGLTIINAHIFTMWQGGAGIYIDGSSPTINKCVIKDNYAELLPQSHYLCLGGGIYIGADCNPLITNCLITGNSVGDWGWGGGIYCDYFANGATLRNCLISNNSALGLSGSGGGIYCDGRSDLIVEHCNIINNSAAQDGGGINFYIYPYFYMFDPPVRTFTNSIIYGNMPDQVYPRDEVKIVGTYTDIQDGWAGAGNIDVDPAFADETNNNFYLKSEGWRWDKDRKQWTWDYQTSRCIDAGNPGCSLGNEPITLDVDPLNRFGENLRIDMGMYGNTSHASMPPYGWALLADLNNDGTVDFIDYSFFADLYYQQGQILNADLNRNGNVNLEDLNLMALDWLAFTGWTQN